MRNIIIIILVFISFLGLKDVVEYDYRQYESPFIFLFAILLSMWKALAIVGCWKLASMLKNGVFRKVLKTLTVICATAYSLLCFVNWISSSLYGFGITRRLITILMQTNAKETFEYIPVIWSNIEIDPSIIILLIVIAVSFFVINRLKTVANPDSVLSEADKQLLEADSAENADKANDKAQEKRYKKEKIHLLLAAVVATIVLGGWVILTRPNGRMNYSVTGRTVLAIADVIKFQEEAKMLYAEKKELQFKETVENSDSIDNIVLVIGESIDTRHSSIYGYKLPTNKYTSALKDSILVYKDVISPYCGTNEVMTRMLTFMDDNPQTKAEAWASYPDIVSVMKAAGFNCYWYSNQQKLGNYMDCTTPIASNAQKEMWLTEYGSDNLIEQYDDALLPLLKKALEDSSKKRFIVMHMMGAHPDFKCRYPRSQTLFTAKDYAWNNKIMGDKKARAISAEYDNAVAYSDSVVAEAAKIAMKSKGRTMLLYVSDHGQNVYDSESGFGHHEDHVNVPLLVFCNKAYIERNKGQLSALNANLSKPITTANLIHALLGLAGVRYKLFDEKCDFSSKKYAPGVRYANSKQYNIKK